MAFNVVAVCEVGENSGAYYPILNDELLVTGEPLDGGFGEALQVSSIEIRRKVGNSWVKEMTTTDLKLQAWISSSRVVIYCRNYDKGGGWSGWGVGGIAVALTANAISKAMAANRRKGKALVGHLRFPWISAVSFSRRLGWGSEESIRLSYVDGSETTNPACDITLSLPRHVDANRIARDIVDRIIAYRYTSGESMTAEELAGFEALRTGGLIAAPEKGRMSKYAIPTSFRVPGGLQFLPVAPPLSPPGEPSERLRESAAAAAIEAAITPVDAGLASADARLDACHACGSIYVGRSFCTDCGAPVDPVTA